MLLLGFRVLGRTSILYTLWGTAALSFFLWVFEGFAFPLDDPWLAALFAGVTMGSGLGLIFRCGGTTGGVATGAFTNEPRQVLVVAAARSEVVRLKSLVFSVDPTAFVIVGAAKEVMGEGFPFDSDVEPLKAASTKVDAAA